MFNGKNLKNDEIELTRSRTALLLTLAVFGGWSTADAQTFQNGMETTGLTPGTGNANLTHHQRHSIRTADGCVHIFLKTEEDSDKMGLQFDPDELASLKLFSNTTSAPNDYTPQLTFGASSSRKDDDNGVDYDGSDSTCDVIADPTTANVFHLVYNTYNNNQKSGIKYVRLTYTSSPIPPAQRWMASPANGVQVITAEAPNATDRTTYIRPTIAVQSPSADHPAITIWLAFIQCDVPNYPITTTTPPTNPPPPSQATVDNIQYSYRVYSDRNTALTFLSDPYAGSLGATSGMPEAGALPAKQKVPTRSIRILAAGSGAASFVGAVYSDAIDYTFDPENVPDENPQDNKPDYAVSAPVKFGLIRQKFNSQGLEVNWQNKDGFYARDSYADPVTDINYVDQYDGDGAHFCAVAVTYGTTVVVHFVTNDGFNKGFYARYRPSTNSFSSQRPFDAVPPDQDRFVSQAAYMQVSADNAGNVLTVFSAKDTFENQNAKPLFTYRSSNSGTTWTEVDSVLLLPYMSMRPVFTDVPRFDTPAILTPSQNILQQVQETTDAEDVTFYSYNLP